MCVDLEEEVLATTVMSTMFTGTYSTVSNFMMRLYCYRVACLLLYSSIRGPPLIGSLDSGGSCHCSSAGPPGSGHCRIYHHLVPEEVRWKPTIIATT